MALLKTRQVPHASSSQAAGASTTGDGGWLPIGYGVSIVARIANTGGTLTLGCDVFVEVATDAAGTDATEVYRATAPITNGLVSRFPINFGLAGVGGDFSHYRVSFAGNTGFGVTISAIAQATTSL